MKTIPRLSRVRSAVYGTPWAITPEWLEAICEILERNVMAEKIEFDFENKSKLVDAGGNNPRGPQYIVQDGVAIVSLLGPIFPRANLMTRMSGATSIEEFAAAFTDALSNNDVKAIILKIDSPGGSVLGLGEAATKVFSARKQDKPVIALAEGMAASAAYFIGSQADEFYCTEGSIVGSIGTVMMMEDDSRQAENEGIRRIPLKTGKLKAIGTGPITDEQVAHYTGIMNDYFAQFKDAVVRGRPGIDIDAVATGAIWVGQKACDEGLCDGVSTLENILADLS